MSRETENVVLLLMGIATGMIALTGAYTRYVKPSLLPWLIVTAVVLLALAGSAIFRDIRNDGPPRDDTGHQHHGRIAWFLVVPIAALGFVVPPALRPSAATPTVTAVSTDLLRQAYPPLPAGRAPDVSLPEVVSRAAYDTSGSLEGRLISVTGFSMPGAGGLDLGRVVLMCCAADARLARIHLAGAAVDQAAALPEDTWLRIEGMVTPLPADSTGVSVPTMTVSAVSRIDPPANSYGN